MISGKKVALRAVEDYDLQKLLEWRNNPEFRKFFREYRELNLFNQKSWFERYVNNDEHTRMFSIVDASNGELLGACGLCYIDWVNRSADFSIYIGWNDIYIDDIYAIEAAELMIKYGFNELNLHRLWTEIYSIDSKKRLFFDKLGFIEEAIHKETHWTEGNWVDSLYFRLTRSEWCRRNK